MSLLFPIITRIKFHAYFSAQILRNFDVFKKEVKSAIVIRSLFCEIRLVMVNSMVPGYENEKLSAEIGNFKT